MNKKLTFILVALMLITACRTAKTVAPQANTLVNSRDYSIQALLWQQHAAEYKALAYQAYNIAKLSLDNILITRDSITQPLAIITDIDETVLDNSPFNGKMLELNEEYSRKRWIEWGKLEAAKPVPGSLDFFKYAKEKGVEVFYISNRREVQKPETIANLKKYNYPFADKHHVLLRKDTSGKETRRNKVLSTHEIVMLLGDNLSDFSMLFDDKSTEERNQLVANLNSKFGKKFIVLPNPMYGDWETKGIFEGKFNWTPKQRDSILRKKVKSY